MSRGRKVPSEQFKYILNGAILAIELTNKLQIDLVPHQIYRRIHQFRVLTPDVVNVFGRPRLDALLYIPYG